MGHPRRGKTLLELLIVVALVAVLVALLLAAVQKVRQRAARLRDENNFRQVGLAAHGYQTQHGRLPPLIGLSDKPESYPRYPIPVAAFLLPHLDQPSADKLLDPRGSPFATPYHSHVVPAYVSSLDPSHTKGRVVLSGDMRPGVGNAAFNVQVFGPKYPTAGEADGKASLSGTVPDGTSNTLLLATKRGRCGPSLDPSGLWSGGSWWMTTAFKGQSAFGPPPAPFTQGAFFGQSLPAADGTGPTFQVTPALTDCDPELAQGFHSGLTVGLADGSVRTVRADIAPTLWRAGLLPNDGAGLPAD